MTASQSCGQRLQSPDVTAGELNCHWAKRGDVAETEQSDWCRQWKSGEVKGYKRRWPAQLPNILSTKQVSVSDAT